ncbi:hypothetical protein K402DRAFT_18002 [Aulographum hederae CBS 113979]|uniref:Zinc finger PHD-type domain-containing protein n=1 Tax=Aulographum hederae CBS 113979 TaxID=1176131 RepID=A0A6G1H640_9PEZI|nr:hypothetical protein K402DRAFT_18002 [Aulographum hederae CBS 113979]
MSPRRSSRARTTQPPAPAPTHSNSNSSASSVRAERSTRSNNKQSSPQKSSTPHSLSSEDAADPSRSHHSEPPQTRRSRRAQDNEEGDTTKMEDEEVDEIAEEEEVTRCICGQQDYPGPPADAVTNRHHKNSHSVSSVAVIDPLSEDAGGLFIQCDICKVWQHGGCVGIMDEAASPDEYFCELCKPNTHQLKTDRNGQKFSIYRPVIDKSLPKSHRKASASKEPEPKSSKDKEKMPKGVADSLTKRRSTMNSRAAWEEDEVLRKVIEESKQEDGPQASISGTRKGKRNRDDSEDGKQESKRQRTHSGSLSSPTSSPGGSPAADSDEEALAVKAAGAKKPRGAAARSQREKELREKEKQRSEAANNRKGRADRRRAEESEAADDAARNGEAPSEINEPTPSQPPESPHISGVAGRKGKGAGKKGRGGWNSHSARSREPNTMDPASTTASPNLTATHRKSAKEKDRAGDKEMSVSPKSGAMPNGTPTAAEAISTNTAAAESSTKGNGNATTNGNGTTRDSDSATDPNKPTTSARGGRPGKYSKTDRLERTSIKDMEKKVQGMLDYIGKTQVEIAGKRATGISQLLQSLGVDLPMSGPNGENKDEFKEMSTEGMMDALTRELVKWQKEFGRLGEK